MILNMSSFKKISLILCLMLSSLALYFSFHFDYYSDTVGKIIDAKTISKVNITDEHGNQDYLISQELEVKLLNSKDNGKTIFIPNSYSYSQVKDQQYQEKDLIFLHVTSHKNQLTGTIIDLKRDHYLILLISLLVILLILVADKTGLLIFLSLIVNGTLLATILIGYRSMDSNLLLIMISLSLPIIVTVTLTVANGWNLKTKAAIVSTITGSVLTFLLGYMVIELLKHNGLHYEEMELVTRPPHVLFLSSLLLGSIGAVMDVSITIISPLFELVKTKKEMTLDELQHAGKKIGEDIMGPMINIMFFSYLSGSIPLILIFLKNGMSLSYSFSIILSLEIARALVGSIGIIIAIPISIKITSYFLEKRWFYDC